MSQHELLLPGWDTTTDRNEQEDEEGNMILGYFGVEETRCSSAATQGAFRKSVLQ